MPNNFLGVPEVSLKDTRFVVLPIPYEETTSGRTGTKNGPEAIISTSRFVELYDEQLDSEPYLAGIKTLPAMELVHGNPKKMVSSISNNVSGLVRKGKIVAGLGGEHTVSLGMVRGCMESHPDMNVLSFDAHADLRDAYEGTRFSHACVSKRMLELGCRLVAAGIRSISKEERKFLDDSERCSILWGHDMAGTDWYTVLNTMLPAGNYYITFDLDFFDPSILPETGTPEPGGFQWHETMRFFQHFLSREDITIVGFDVVELAPQSIFTPSSFLAAKLVYKIMGYISSGGQCRSPGDKGR